MPADSVDLGGDQEMYIFLSSLDDSDIQPGLESLLFGICLQLPQKIFFLTVLGIPLSSKFFFSFFFFYHNLVSSGFSTSSLPVTTLAKVIITFF